MHGKNTKTIAALVVFMFILTILPLQAPLSVSAAGLAVNVSDSYRNSVFYERACAAYNSASNPIERFVNVALSQEGYVGGSASGQWGGTGPNGKHTEYGRFMGKDGYDWCASFVSWCAAAAGIPTSVIPRSARAGHWSNVNTGTFTRLWSNNFTTYNDYKPQVGDLALYMPYHDKAGCYKHYNANSPSAHVVIVASVSNTKNADGSWTFTTIERGNNNTVQKKTLTTKTSRGKGGTCACGLQPAGTYSHVVQGFFRPNYSSLPNAPQQVVPSTPSSTPNVQFSLTNNPEYKQKEAISETNAVVVNQVVKPAGTSVSAMGLYLYDRNGNLIKRHQETVTNVRAAGTTYHGWYDINAELGISLKPATTYQYKFFGVFNGYEVAGPVFSFNTAGKNTVQFDATGGSYVSPIQLGAAAKLGALPEPYRDGYLFDGWYTQPSGGNLVDASTIIYEPTTLYAHWRENETTPEIDNSYDDTYTEDIEDEPCDVETYTVHFILDGDIIESIEVANGEAYRYLPKITLRDAVFLGWYTHEYGGEQIFPDTIAYLDGPTYLYAHYEMDEIEDEYIPEEDYTEDSFYEPITIIMQIGNPWFTKNGTLYSIDDNGTVPITRQDRTLVPVRALVEALGGTVEWNEALQGVTMSLDGTILDLFINRTRAYVNDQPAFLDVAPILHNERTMLPIRFIAENFGATVEWEEETQCIYITR